jgi:queuine tRNA-ribosyltransferase
MLAAGFHVSRGRNAGDKEETTIAFTCLEKGRERQREILGAEWLKKWERSSAKFPSDLNSYEREAFEQTIRSRPQFQVRADA